MLLQEMVVVLRDLACVGERAATPAPLDCRAAADGLDQPIFFDREIEEVRLTEPLGVGAQLLRHRKIDIAGLLPTLGNVFERLVVIDLLSRSKHEGKDLGAVEIREATSDNEDDKYCQPVGQHGHLLFPALRSAAANLAASIVEILADANEQNAKPPSFPIQDNEKTRRIFHLSLPVIRHWGLCSYDLLLILYGAVDLSLPRARGIKKLRSDAPQICEFRGGSQARYAGTAFVANGSPRNGYSRMATQE